ncbi:hypothetical protein Q428_09410 [Fervidicella metallireducens AeB]|uniref:Uncharacterized protein n=2 Tax=Fervidicella TaxID=1403538 RepID=A0A017RU92_9CLOT|nr:hypothetical protein Q428_09410 [Fervidicella metallireducens AeB]
MGLKESKKFAIGSFHENGGGKFEILERWFDEKTNQVMLKYRYLGDGRIETNKEANVNASEWKWRKVRGLAGNRAESSPIKEEERVTMTRLEERLNDIYIKIENLFVENTNIISDIHHEFEEHRKILHEMMHTLAVQQKQIEQLVNDRSLINKLLEKV